MMGPKSFPRIVYITSIKGWVHDYTLFLAEFGIALRSVVERPMRRRLSLMRRWKILREGAEKKAEND
jgi:hypothetical protein